MKRPILRIGLDIGSTTVKAVVVDDRTNNLLLRMYQRHESRQSDIVLKFLKTIESEFPNVRSDQMHVWITGTGGKVISEPIGAKYVQEVSAICRMVAKLHPETDTVIELGGQDAKIIVFKKDPETGVRRKFLSMNEKCGGGTGAVIDKLSAKLGIPPEQLADMGYDGIKIHHIAGKCGVFAETDMNSLLMQGIPKDQLMASLFKALVEQNLSVLTRGHSLGPTVLLLGGPNTLIRGMQEAWRTNLQEMWVDREITLPDNVDPKKLIQVPENSLYFAALGATEYTDSEIIPVYQGVKVLEEYIALRDKRRKQGTPTGLWASRQELDEFKDKYRPHHYIPPTFHPGDRVSAFIGLDGGSTSTKAILFSPDQEVLAKAYRLSQGNPIEETKEMFAALRSQIESQGATLEILGLGVTGYAEGILKDLLQADVDIVETVAHTHAALHYYRDVDVICDVGGQDIKIMTLKEGRVKDFKLNTQCSAGNGYFLQSTSKDFGIPIENYADMAFEAEAMPHFGYGCAIFLQSDIVNFQRQGWKPSEIMAGLATVLPRNIWLYVAQIPNLPKLGTNFVLQGGTQRNLAAVKAQVDFIKSKFEGTNSQPNIIVHKHCGESGAIGAALEALRLWQNGRESTFIGLDATENLQYSTTTNEDTRCHFCKNECMRTFIDVTISGRSEKANIDTSSHHQPGQPTPDLHLSKRGSRDGKSSSKVPLPENARRLIIGNACEKGSVENLEDMKSIKRAIDQQLKGTPNFAELSVKAAFRSYSPENEADPIPRFAITKKSKRQAALRGKRSDLRIGIPRLLNMYSVAPLFSAYFESLGIQFRNMVYSDYTTEQLYREGIKRGAIDPCYPAKLAIPHIHNLIFVKHKKRPLDIIFFPMIDDIPSDLVGARDSRSCPTITATPQGTKAAFIKEGNVFKRHGIRFLNTFVNIGQPLLFERQMYLEFRDILGLSKTENARAIRAGYAALADFKSTLRMQAKQTLEMLQREKRIGILLLSRPYHNDPGINHNITVELQIKGYPVLTPESLPVDEETLERLFNEDIYAGIISHPMEISDVWKHTFSEISSRKLWAAKFAARHPNLAGLELSSFKCGHDAPLYTLVEEIIEYPGTPYFCFKDLDENKPSNSIRIRIKTIDYFLTRYCESLFNKTDTRTLVPEQGYT